MNLYNNEDENKGGAPVLKGGAPFKKSSIFGRTPMLSRAAGGIMDRLKNLSRRDMAFVGVGLSVLVMAPVAEYVMSKPSSDNLLAPGFGSRDGSAISGLYEPGINALSQGSSDGSGEVISPLSFRDPASLILGSQPAQAPAMAAPPPDMGMRDAMKDSGRAAFSAAAQSAGLPTVIPKMQSALRGVSSFAGGGEGSRTSGGLSGKNIIDDAKSASSKAAKHTMVGPVGGPGYKGVASNTPNSASKSALEKLRSQADKSAGNFSGGSAASALDKAAADAVSIGHGDGGFGSGGEGDKGKSPSNSTNKNSHSSSGESLAAQAAKARQAKALEWEFFKQYEIPKQIITAILTGFTGSLTKFVGGITDDLTGQTPGAAPAKLCWQPANCSGQAGCAAYISDHRAEWGFPLKMIVTELCYQRPGRMWMGALSNSVSPSKGDKATLTVADCVCGENDKMIGDKSGSNTVSPSTTTPPGENDPNSPFAEFDGVLRGMVNLTVEGEAKIADPAALAPITQSIVGGFDNMGAPAAKVRTGLTTAATANVTALTAYITALGTSRSTARSADAAVRLYVLRLKSIADATTLKGLVTTESVGVIEGGPATIIKEMATAYMAQLNANMAVYNARLEKQEAFSTFYSGQVRQVAAGIGAIGTKLTPLKTTADGIFAGNDPAPDKFKKVTGRPTEQQGTLDLDNQTPPINLNDNPNYATNFAGGDLRSAPNEPAIIPLKVAALVRGLDWTILWQQDHKFDSGALAATEAAAETQFNSALAATPPAQPVDTTDLGNFAINKMRSDWLKAGIAFNTASLANELDPRATNLTGEMARITTEFATYGLNACYLTAGGSCGSGTLTPPDGPGTGAGDSTYPDYKVTTLGEARTSLSSAAGVKSAATTKNTTLQAFIPAAGKKEEMDGYKAQGAAALAKITASHEAIGRLVTEMEACTNRACVTGKKAAIAAETAKIEAARLELELAYTRAEAIKQAPVVAPSVTTAQIRQQAEDAYNRIVAAKGRADMSMSGFPTGTAARNEKKRLADEKMTALNRLRTDAGALNTRAQDTTTTRAQVIAARDSLRVKATSAETLASAIASLRTQANALTSGKCYETEKGCARVAAFYTVMRWNLKPKLAAIGTIGLLSAPEVAYNEIAGDGDDVSSDGVARLCDKAWAKPGTWDYIMSVGSLGGKKADCAAKWFTRVYKVGYDARGVIRTEGDNLRMISGDTLVEAGQLTYTSNRNNVFSMGLELGCERQSGVWKVTSASLRVDQPTSTSQTIGVNASVGPSFAKIGATYTQSTTITIPFGGIRAMPYVIGFPCGNKEQALQ